MIIVVKIRYIQTDMDEPTTIKFILGLSSILVSHRFIMKKVLTQDLSHRLSKSARLDVENFTLLWNGFLDIYRISEWWYNRTVYFAPAFETLQTFYLSWILFCSIRHKVLAVTSVPPLRDASNMKYRHLKQFLSNTDRSSGHICDKPATYPMNNNQI